MTEFVKSPVSSRLRLLLLFAAIGTASIVLFWHTLRDLVALSLSADAYSYILLIPFISAFVVYLERRKIFAVAAVRCSAWKVALLAGALTLYGIFATGVLNPPADYRLSLEIACIFLVWAAVFALCCGMAALRSARFPFLLLLLLVPIPLNLMDKIVTSLQWGAAEATYVLFQVAGVPVFRRGVNFELPVVGIEIARECSSIHSACALFITSLLVGHLFLRSLRGKVCLTLLAIPIAMFANAVRITTLWFLAVKVDIGFLYGNLHHDGGVVFALVGLSISMGCAWLLRKLEGRGGRQSGLTIPVGVG